MSPVAVIVHILCASMPAARAQALAPAEGVDPLFVDQAPDGPESMRIDPALVAGQPATPIDRIVAVVGDRLVTTSDILLEQVLARHDPSPLSVVADRQSTPLEWLVDAAVIRGLAGEVSIYQPNAAQVRDRVERLRTSFATPDDYEAFLRAFGLDQDSLEGIYYTRLVVERYVARNLDLREDSDAGGSPATRYATWIDERRSVVAIRMVKTTEER